MNMQTERDFANLLSDYMEEQEYGAAKLASQVNRLFGSDFLHRNNVTNWKEGVSKKVKNWQQVAAIAYVLHLDELQASDLLIAAGHPSILELWQDANDKDRQFLASWVKKAPLQKIVADINDIKATFVDHYSKAFSEYDDYQARADTLMRIHGELESVLLACAPISDIRELHALFADPRLKPFRKRLPDTGGNPFGRVKMLIAYLIEQYSSEPYKNALVLLLYVLSEGYETGNECQQRLRQLANELEQVTRRDN